jgi:hypothetical protein
MATASEPPEKLHFISGLPRSGSALLSGILKQNPRFSAGMTSPLGDMISTLVAEMSGKNDFSVAISDEQRQAVPRGVFRNFYGGCTGTNVLFDTGRVRARDAVGAGQRGAAHPQTAAQRQQDVPFQSERNGVFAHRPKNNIRKVPIV